MDLAERSPMMCVTFASLQMLESVCVYLTLLYLAFSWQMVKIILIMELVGCLDCTTKEKRIVSALAIILVSTSFLVFLFNLEGNIEGQPLLNTCFRLVKSTSSVVSENGSLAMLIGISGLLFVKESKELDREVHNDSSHD